MTEGGSLGPYRIVREIGSGSFGSVLLGRHEETGVEVAIKTVKVPSEHRVSSLRREIQALARVRHPGVVRILDDGVTSRGPWYAMDLLAGTTLTRYVQGVEEDSSLQRSVDLQASTELLAASLSATRVMSSDRTEVQSSSGGWSSAPGRSLFGPPSPPQARPRILTIVRRLCAPLSYLHGEGILHRDLKPDNVLVTADGMPVIVDFGLTSEAFDAELRETMEVVGEIAGTALYMAPEQARGELLDARADLYALGCILYQLLTGRPPFLAETAAQILLMHVNHAPVPPSALCGDLDPKVDDVVLRLLAKEPRERLGHADDVAQALLALGAAVEPLAGPPPRTYLYRPALAGRDEILAALDEPIGRLREDRGGLVLLPGEAGVGKTRLLKEVGRRAAKLGYRVIASDCAPALEGGTPLQGFRGVFEAIADRCRERGRDEAERLVGGQAAILAPYDAGVRRLSDSLGLKSPAPLSPEAAVQRLHRALGEVLVALVRTGGMAILVDDLHEADELTLGALRYLARTRLFTDCPVLLVASYRPEDSGGELSVLSEEAIARQVPVDRLDDTSIASIASDMLALRPLPDPFRRFLRESSEGNPFFVAQYLRTAVSEGVLSRDASGRWRMRRVDASQAQLLEDAIPLPATLRDLAARRLAGVSPAAADVLRHACILGRDVDAALLSEVAGIDDTRIAEGVAELVRRHCMLETEAGLRFRQASLRDVAYEAVPPADRAAIHRRAAEALERADRGDGDSPALAQHWERAGVPDRAIPCYMRAARASRVRYAWRESERLLRSVIRLSTVPSVETVHARAELGEILVRTGRTSAALAEHARSLDDARALGDVALEGQALTNMATCEQILGDVEGSRAHYEEGIAVLHALGHHRFEANALENLALLLQNTGRPDVADETHRKALATHRAVGNVPGQLTSLLNLGALRNDQGRWSEAIAILEEGLALARSEGDRESEANLLGNIAAIHHSRGALPEARGGYEPALSIFRELGARVGESVAQVNLAHVALEQGRLGEAHDLVAEAKAIAIEMEGQRQMTFAALVEGWLAEEEGRLDDAREAFREALRLIERRSPQLELDAWRSMALVDARQGRFDDAARELDRAMAVADPRADPLGTAWLGIARATFLREAGRSSAASRALLDESEAALRAAGDILRLAACLCEQGQHALLAGEDARPRLDEVERLIAPVAAGPLSPARRRAGELAQAIAGRAHRDDPG